MTIIIPSRTATNLLPCLRAIRENQPHDVNLLVVDDGLTASEQIAVYYLQAAIVSGQKPFIFARNINIGIAAAGTDDVILLNDDALLKTPGGFSALQEQSRQNPEYGIISAVTNAVGNPNQEPKGIGLREEARMLCFVCVYIPRRTIEQVGLLDTRYTEYGFDDDDYSLRVRQAGLKLGIFDGCFVDHASLRSTFRGNGFADLKPNQKLFREKWGELAA